jgi:hypothetical protein
MSIPNRNWLLRTRRNMCGNFQDLCGIETVNRQRGENGEKAIYDPSQLAKLKEASDKLGEAIDALNVIVELPRGS